MRISILTLFPEMFIGPLDFSIIGKAQKSGLVDINIVNIRDFGFGSRKTVDDRVFGGGKGMILRVDILDKCLSDTIKSSGIARNQTWVILTDPRGQVLEQKLIPKYLKYKHLIIICGHYEGIDNRISHFVDQ